MKKEDVKLKEKCNQEACKLLKDVNLKLQQGEIDVIEIISGLLYDYYIAGASRPIDMEGLMKAFHKFFLDTVRENKVIHMDAIWNWFKPYLSGELREEYDRLVVQNDALIKADIEMLDLLHGQQDKIKELQKENKDRAFQFKQREDIFSRKINEQANEISDLQEKIESLSIPKHLEISPLQELLKYSTKYEINIQFWPDQTAVFIAKDGVDLTDFGGDFDTVIQQGIDYLTRISKK